MSIRSELTPYSQKSVLRESFLPDTFEGISSSHLPLAIDAKIVDYCYPQMNEYIQYILKNMDALASKLPHFYHNKASCNINSQPIWSMDSPSDPVDPKKNKTTDDTCLCPNYNTEPLAYYLPAHNENPALYGIHITHEGVATLAKDITNINQIHSASDSDIALAALFKLYAHELTHGWIEDLVSLLDTATGEKSPTYQKTANQYNHYIFMEEAICNTAAYGWLKSFLSDHAQSDTILDAFTQWMKASPKGYCDFLEIPTKPHQNSKFIENVYYLLERVYKPNAVNAAVWSNELITQTIATYFGGKISYDRKCFISKPVFYEHCLWADNIPVHLEHYDVCYSKSPLIDSTLSKNGLVDENLIKEYIEKQAVNLHNCQTNTLLNNEFVDEKSIKNWLAEHNIDHYSIDVNLVVSVEQNVILSSLSTTILPVKFKKIDGDFYLYDCPNLESFKNCPTEVTGVFHVNNLPKIKLFEKMDWQPDKINSMYIDCSEITSFMFLGKSLLFNSKTIDIVILDKINQIDNLLVVLLCNVKKIVLQSCISEKDLKALEIVKKYIDLPKRKDSIMDCCMELIDAGYEKAAES